jgi:hypothetical protein
LRKRTRNSILGIIGVLFGVPLVAWMLGADTPEALGQITGLTVVMLVVLGFRVYMGHILGAAARRRNCGYAGWRISSLLFGPIITLLFYLAFVSWRPIIPQHPSLKETQQST